MSYVLTLALDEQCQKRFEALRQQWFPPERNQIPAHLTLFHQLPEASDVQDALRMTAGQSRSFPMRVIDVRSLGRGVAYFLEASEANELHQTLSTAFCEDLTAQDRQSFRPHVVVQNKVDAVTAKQTLALLQAGFAPWHCLAVGLDLWRYQGGPWEFLERISFVR